MNFKNIAVYRAQLKRDLMKHFINLTVERIDSDVDGIVNQCLYEIEEAGDKVDGRISTGYLGKFSITNKFSKVGEDVVVDYTLHY